MYIYTYICIYKYIHIYIYIYIYIYIRGSLNKFPEFFVWALLLIVHTWNSSPLPSNLLRLQCTSSTVPKTSGRPHGRSLVWACLWPSSQRLSSPQLSHNDSVWAQEITKSHREQGLDSREGEELSGCPSWSNSLWQRWGCGLVHCPSGNATDPIRRVLASSNGISPWTPLKPQHSNPNPNPSANELWCIDFHTSHHPSQTPCLPWISYATQNWCSIHARCSKSSVKHSIRFCGIFSKFKTILLHIVFLKCPDIQIAFLKFTSCDNQALVGYIPIATTAVHLKLKS